MLDEQQREHPGADVEPSEKSGGEQTGPGAPESLLAFVDQPVEGLLGALLWHVRIGSPAISHGTPCGPAIRVRNRGPDGDALLDQSALSSMADRALAALGIDADAVIGQVDALDIDTTADVPRSR